MHGIIIAVVGCVLMYVLYDNGYIGITSKAAVTFLGSYPKKTSWKASFTKCKGTMKRVIRFEESKTYQFKLDAEIDSGEVVIEVMDASKQVVLTLNTANPTGSVIVGDNKKYHMVVRIQSATGNYKVNWE